MSHDNERLLHGWLRAAAGAGFALVALSAVVVCLHRIYFQPEWATSIMVPVVAGVVSTFAHGVFVPRARLGWGGVVVLVCLVAYMIDFPRARSRDVLGTEYTALSIATGRGTALDDYPEMLRGGLPYYVTQTPEGLRSEFAIGPALVAWPLYLPAPWSPLPRSMLVHRLGSLAAILLALASVWLVYRIGERLAPPISPALLALAYGIGTSHWGTSAGALWLHGPAELWALGAIDRLVDDEASPVRRLAALGACMTLAVFTRPPVGVAIVLLAGFVLSRYRAKAVVAFAAASVVALPLVGYHVATYGSILGAYASRGHGMVLKSPSELAETVFWLIASPSRGVFWYEPVVVVTLVVALAALVPRGLRAGVGVGLLGFLATACVYASWVDWWGGVSFGPRYMTDALPWWILATAYAGIPVAGLRAAVVPLIIIGALVNVAGIVGPWAFWDARPSVLVFPERVRSLGDSQLLIASLGSAPWDNDVRQALRAERAGELDDALTAWESEWASRPWHQFAAFQIAELLLRTDRLDGAMAHAELMAERWPEHPYVIHLEARLPAIARLLEDEAWIVPESASASRHPGDASRVLDGRLATQWTSLPTRQRKGDWIELRPPPGVAVRGVALIAAPEFADGPEGVEVLGTSATGEQRTLARSERIVALNKGWVVMRFPAAELVSVRVVLAQNRGVPWTVSEARLLVML